MCGSDTLTTVVSSTSMKVPNITEIAISHGLMWRSGCGRNPPACSDVRRAPRLR